MAESDIKTGTIKSVAPEMYGGEHSKDKNGNYKHSVVMSDGAKGTCSTKDQQASSWPVGEEVKYKIRRWTSPDGTKSRDYFSLVRPDGPYKKGGFSGGLSSKGEKEYKAEAVLVAGRNAAQTVSLREDLTEKDYHAYLKAFL